MTKNVLISLKGTQYSEGETNIEIIYTGVYFYKNNMHYIGYEEISDDGDKTRNTIKLGKGYVEITRRGIVESEMKFIENVTTGTLYRTPYGSINMDIFTEILDVLIRENNIRIKMKYSLAMDGEKGTECDMEIRIRPY